MLFHLVICSFTIASVAFACQPTPTTTQQQVRTFVADSPINIPRLINVEPSRVPIAPAAPVQTIFDLLRIPLPQSVTESTTQFFSSTEESELNSTITDDFSTKNLTINLESEFDSGTENGTDSSDNLVKDLAEAEKAVLSTFSDPKDEIITTVRPALKLFAAPANDDSSPKCTDATITAITIMPYDDRLVGLDLDKLHQQVSLLEAYTQRKFSSFGEFSEEVTNIDGKFALRYNIKFVKDCSELRNFATKAVSYSREIERIQYSCLCQPIWIIAKRKVPQNKNF